MAEEENKKEQKKRGRPAKVESQPIVNDTPEELQMAQIVNQNVDLSNGYSRALGVNVTTNGWLGSINNLNLYNPFLQNQRLKMLNTLPGTMERDELTKSLLNPQNNEMKLRSEAWSLSSTQYLYYKILRLACDVPMYKWYVTPDLLNSKDYKSKEFVAEDKFVNEWLTKFDLTNTLKRTALEVKREGKQAYALRSSVGRNKNGDKIVNYATLQKLPSNFIKLVKIGEHGYIPAFNMMVFMNPGFSPLLYPEFIQQIWRDMIDVGAIGENITDGTQDVRNRYSKKQSQNKYYIADFNKLQNYSFNYDGAESREELRGTLEISRQASKTTYFFWVQLPQDLCYVFCSDTSNPWTVPDTAGLLLSLDELSDYDTLQGLIESTPLTAVLTAEAETIPNPNAGKDQTILNPETIAAFQEKFNSSTSTNLEALFAPLKNFKLLSLPAQPNSSEISANATKNVITRAGLGGLLITTDKPSVSQVKTAQYLAESEADFVTGQFESVLNMIVNKLIGCKYKWNVHIWGNIFTFSDEVKRDKELFVAGASFLFPKLASAYDLTLRDTRAIELYVESLDLYKDLKTITQEKQEEITEKKNNIDVKKQGRPEADLDESENDNTLKSKDSGLDTSETR